MTVSHEANTVTSILMVFDENIAIRKVYLVTKTRKSTVKMTIMRAEVTLTILVINSFYQTVMQ